MDIFRRFRRNPGKKFFQSVELTPKHTPDNFALEEQAWHLLFEYGEMQVGMPKHKFIDDLPIHPLVFTQSKFSLWKSKKGKESIVIPLKIAIPEHPIPRASIMGQLFRIKPETFEVLDNYKENGVQFIRKRIPIIMPPSDTVLRAWMYVGIKSFWEARVAWDYCFYRSDHGRDFGLVKTFNSTSPLINPYQHYTHAEYESKDNRTP